jgi:hypothetical protein
MAHKWNEFETNTGYTAYMLGRLSEEGLDGIDNDLLDLL